MWLPRVRNAFGDLAMPERDAIEKPQRADGLVQRRPRDPRRYEVHLKGADILQAQPIRRTAKISAELRHRVKVGSLCCRRQIADGHVLDHTAAQRAQLSHRGLLSQGLASTTTILSDRTPSRNAHPDPAAAGSFNPVYGSQP